MSASAIADGLVTMLSAASVFGSGNVAKNSYQILETSTGSCAVVQWTRLISNPMTFGDPRSRQRTWNFQIRCFVRDTGDPNAVLNRVWSATDGIIACLESDDTIQNTAQSLNSISGTRDPESAFTVGGATWLPFDIGIEVNEF